MTDQRYSRFFPDERSALPPPLDTDVAIETPEHIVFRHRLAGPTRRAMAQLIDGFVCYGALAIVYAALALASLGAATMSERLSGMALASVGLGLVLLFAVQWVYFVAWEGLTGRTPGKMALGLRVVTTSGRPIGLAAAALRNILRAADMLPTSYLLGGVIMAFSTRFQRLGDMVAGTMVVIPDEARSVAPLQLWPPPEPHELATLPDEVILDAEERAGIELFLRRRGKLGAAREAELANLIVHALAVRHGFRLPDPSRTLALLYDRAVNAGRSQVPASVGSVP